MTEKLETQTEAIDKMKESLSNSAVDQTGQVRQSPSIVFAYSKDELMELRVSPAATHWPTVLDLKYVNARGVWDPDRWHQSLAKGSTPTIDSDKSAKSDRPTSSLSGDGKSRRDSKDPKERLKSELQDTGIVLSPQRRSFLTGCQGSSSSQSTAAKEEISLRPDTTSRRVGSGRILNRDREKEETFERERDSRRFDRRGDERYGNGYRQREDEDPRKRREQDDFRRRDNDYDRRNEIGRRWSGRRDDDSRRGGPNAFPRSRDDRRINSRFSDSRHEKEEPEWMTATIDQGELMELGGFDDSVEKEVRSIKKGASVIPHDPAKNVDRVEEMRKAGSSAESASKVTALDPDKSEREFALDDIFHLDVIPGLAAILGDDSREDLGPSVSNRESQEHNHEKLVASGGRFSQFFQRSQQQMESSEKTVGEKAPTVQRCVEMNQVDQTNLTQIPSVRIPSPGDPSAYFAPVSPAAKTSDSYSILNLLAVGSGGAQKIPTLPDSRNKDVKSVEEIEANIKQLVGVGNENPKDQSSPRDLKAKEMSAFEKFAAMVTGGNAPSNSQRVAVQPGSGRINTAGLVRPSPQPGRAHTESGDLASIMNATRQAHMGFNRMPSLPSQPQQEVLSLIFQAPFNPEVLNRPEAQTLQAAIAARQVTYNILLQHFAHGQMPQLQREILLNVLKLAQLQGQIPHPLGRFHDRVGGLSPVNPDPLAAVFAHQRLSPSYFGGHGLSVVSPTPSHRIPSPQELQVHTQQIMQNALIKRKLEEQRENFSRMQGKEKLRSTDSPLSFAPTAVMKKIAADRRDSDTISKAPDLKIHPNSRKENGGFHQNQQELQTEQSLIFKHVQEAEKQSTANHNFPDPRRFVLHQPDGTSANSGGSLSRFFSPELLAQVQSGNAPAMPPIPAQKALTLEEIERQSAACKI